MKYTGPAERTPSVDRGENAGQAAERRRVFEHCGVIGAHAIDARRRADAGFELARDGDHAVAVELVAAIEVGEEQVMRDLRRQAFGPQLAQELAVGREVLPARHREAAE